MSTQQRRTSKETKRKPYQPAILSHHGNSNKVEAFIRGNASEGSPSGFYDKV